jgi:hypothetical protein
MAGQRHRQLLRLTRIRNPLRQIRLPEREEAHALVWRQLTRADGANLGVDFDALRAAMTSACCLVLRHLPPRRSLALAARNLLDKIEQALANLVTLKVVTLVGTVKVTGAGTAAEVSIASDTPPEAACTEIDLLQVDIANTFSAGFAGLANGEIRSFHQL